ncbi:phosphoribosyl-AMP cyclohydrolase [Candidatus Bathyarchaeota archaeon]|nr:phosphoribosyl-AMP cyclohydrolase [Candidatus Bathyarchaeota archaeon]MBS7612807.1 phosphoribosyl-AMP cyclohydrolase [Candidatus Bathyarchaeota archaeon]
MEEKFEINDVPMNLEEAVRLADTLNYRHNGGFIVAVVQDVDTGEVLMVAFMNKEALVKTLTTGLAHYWSLSRGKLWRKGEESGHVQFVKKVYVDCDYDSVLLKVNQIGYACHEGYRSCFHNKVYG